MASPTVFVSSTFYDLKYVREGVRRFIEALGYAVVLSEEGTVFYDPKISAAEACLAEIGNANLFVLILGGRYGSLMPNGELSVTNAEYQQAVKDGIPIFALVESDTYGDYQLYLAKPFSTGNSQRNKVSPRRQHPRIRIHRRGSGSGDE